MALKKSIPSKSGATAAYWRIAGLQIHDWENVVCIILHGYVSETVRRATNEDGSPTYEQLTMAVQRMTPEQIKECFPAGLTATEWPDKTTLYEFLKTLPDWAGATDV